MSALDLPHVEWEVVVDVPVEVADGKEMLSSFSWNLVEHRQSAEAVRSSVVCACDVDEGGGKFLFEKDPSSLFPQVDVHRVVVREVLVVGVDSNLALANDLSEVLGEVVITKDR